MSGSWGVRWEGEGGREGCDGCWGRGKAATGVEGGGGKDATGTVNLILILSLTISIILILLLLIINLILILILLTINVILILLTIIPSLVLRALAPCELRQTNQDTSPSPTTHGTITQLPGAGAPLGVLLRSLRRSS